MMAYSSIGQAGYLLVGLAAVMIHNTAAGTLGLLAFLAVYVVTNIGAFAGIVGLADATGKESYATSTAWDAEVHGSPPGWGSASFL